MKRASAAPQPLGLFGGCSIAYRSECDGIQSDRHKAGDDCQWLDDVSWRVSIRGNPHLMLVGLPGMGKTTCLINICRQLRSAGIWPIIFSYRRRHRR